MHPSMLNILTHCTGPLKVGATLPRLPKNESNLEGLEAHTMHENLLKSTPVDMTDETMYGMVSNSVEYLKKVSAGNPIYVEQSIDLSAVEDGMTGIPDALWYNEKRRDLVVYDLKYGSVPVEADNNWQLMVYAVPYVPHFKPKTVTLIIYQPKLKEPVRIKTYTVQEWEDKIQEIRTTIATAKSDLAKCSSGIHCRRCDCLWGCSTASRHIIEGMMTIDKPMVEDLTNLASKYVMFDEARILAKKKTDQIRSIIITQINAGKRVEHCQIVKENTRLVWNYDEETMLGLLPESCRKTSVLTPTQVRNMKLIPEEMLSGFAKRGNKNSLKILKQEDIRKWLET